MRCVAVIELEWISARELKRTLAESTVALSAVKTCQGNQYGYKLLKTQPRSFCASFLSKCNRQTLIILTFLKWQ